MPDTPKVVSTSPKSLPIAEQGITDAQIFIDLMSALASDVLARRITTSMANSVTNAAGKMLKAAEAQQKYGTIDSQNRRRLSLAENASQGTNGPASA